ncbi:PQQ-binding-like beta-propeller repeat protein [Streptomyces sp. NPDC048211]|uniref:outer membrane protein assembly factor BamB family protein n=1 Tax=Streptomyces sp. NPDC048211 TaxID=3365516 RepID=UPI00372125E1
MRHRLLGLLVILPLLAGCFAPSPPRIAPNVDPEEAFRVPLPVPTDASGGWALVNRRLGVIGQGRVAAKIDEDGKVLWRTALPSVFALTGRPGQTHAVATPSGSLTLVGAAASGRLPRLATLDPVTGAFAMLASSPARPRGELRLLTVVSTTRIPRQAVAVTCLPGASCTLTAWDASTGRVLWKHRTHGPAVFAAPCNQDGERDGVTIHRECDPLAFVADGRLVLLRRGEDRLRSTPVELPRGEIGQVLPTLYRVLVMTVPHGPGCRARAAAYDLTTESRAPVWQRAFTWDQPQAAVRDGCRRDPSIPLLMAYRLTLPDAAGALVGRDFDGKFPLRLKPGEYPVADGSDIAAYRVDGSSRDPDPTPSGTPHSRPAELKPTAQGLGQGTWYLPGSGRKGEIVAVDVYGKITWRRTTSGRPFFLSDNRLVYAQGSSLVAVRAGA